MAKQLNIFLENKPGRLKSVTGVLFENNINMRAMTIQDRKDFGLMKILVDKPEAAHLALTDKGFACALKDILAIEMDDKPGGLYKLSEVLSAAKINIQDAYGFVIEPQKRAVLCLEIDNPSKVEGIIKKHGFNVLSDAKVYEL
jgi:hypothetical protein